MSAPPLSLSTWMGWLAPLLGNATLLDLSLPGAHDTLSYDLSTTVSDGWEDLGLVASLLHDVSAKVGGEFIRTQGQTQGLNITSMLDGGVRFVDFRIMFTRVPGHPFRKDWYCLHGCQTRSPALAYLHQVRDWMDAHPSEIVVFWTSRHGNSALNGTDQYPGTTPKERRQLWKQIAAIFDGLLVDASESPLNATPVSRLVERGQRLVWFAADWAESTGSSTLAIDANVAVDNQLFGAIADWEAGSAAQSAFFRRAGAMRQADKAQNRFLLASLAGSPPTRVVEMSAYLSFFPELAHDRHVRACASAMNVPNLTSWCPTTLMDVSLLANYYSQRTLEGAYLDAASDFPNAIYIDVLDTRGTIRTGTSPINPLWTSVSYGDRGGVLSGVASGTSAYAFTATLIAANIQRACSRCANTNQSTCRSCSQMLAQVEAERQRFPMATWDDPKHGRLSGWPPAPTAASHVFSSRSAYAARA